MIKRILETPFIIFALIAAISFSALAAAFVAEGVLNLEPCQLCITQRYPFAFGLLAGIIGMVFKSKKTLSVILLLLCSIAFLGNSAVAFYHTGVEQHWWESAIEGCTIAEFEDNSGKSILENLLSAPMGDCSMIPWQDPIFGFSMANWNIPFCFGLFLFCLVGAYFVKRRQEPLASS
ncbi:MAG: disulfide bond formation protein B [Alphaproteobacteria bacterium]